MHLGDFVRSGDFASADGPYWFVCDGYFGQLLFCETFNTRNGLCFEDFFGLIGFALRQLVDRNDTVARDADVGDRR